LLVVTALALTACQVLTEAGNTTVYDREIDVATRVDAGHGVEVSAAPVTSRALDEVNLLFGGSAGVVLTSTAAVHVSARPRADGLTVELLAEDGGGPTELPADEPRLVMLRVTSIDQQAGALRDEPTDVPVQVVLDLTVTDPSGVVDVADVTIDLIPVPLDGDDLGIPGAASIDDQRLPRPRVGDVLPTQLADGRPVWVLGTRQGVVVLDARSPHQVSGLVGWCGSMPGFIDSIGGSRFTVTGEYRGGPAPHGLTSYDAIVDGDEVVVTGRLAPPPRSAFADVDFPLLAGPTDGTFCEPDAAVAREANDDGAFLEDFRADPTWVQHDLTDWQRLGPDAVDGWYRTDEADVPDGPHLEGDLLVEMADGQVVDAASPPGTARHLFDDVPSGPVQLVQVEPRIGAIVVRQVFWVSPAGIAPATEDRPEHGRLVAAQPSHALLPETDLPDGVADGDLVDVVTDGGAVVSIERR